MLALLAAATLAAGPEAPKAFVLRQAERPAKACETHGTFQTKTDPSLLYRDEGQVRSQPLARLPKANHEKAVLRSVDGCARPMVVEYGAGR